MPSVVRDGSGVDGQATRILAVDDHTDNLLLLQQLLNLEGYEVEVATSGEEAVAKVEAKPPDLLLLDIAMPRVDGYEVIQRIRRNCNIPFVPIIVMTAHGISYAIEGLNLGANSYISLPIDFCELLRKVELLLRLKQTVMLSSQPGLA
jgi:CheY-like chemotaxis protein